MSKRDCFLLVFLFLGFALGLLFLGRVKLSLLDCKASLLLRVEFVGDFYAVVIAGTDY